MGVEQKSFLSLAVNNKFVLPLQFDMGQSAGIAVSDSSDKSKEKTSDQKVCVCSTSRQVLIFLKIHFS